MIDRSKDTKNITTEINNEGQVVIYSTLPDVERLYVATLQPNEALLLMADLATELSDTLFGFNESVQLAEIAAWAIELERAIHPDTSDKDKPAAFALATQRWSELSTRTPTLMQKELERNTFSEEDLQKAVSRFISTIPQKKPAFIYKVKMGPNASTMTIEAIEVPF